VAQWKRGLDTSSPSIKLVPLAQSLSLHAVLWVFFSSRDDSRVEYLPFNSLVRLSEEINRAWIASKNEDTLIEFMDNTHLQVALATVLPGRDIFDPRENPLRLILPGFETLWRIVLRTFLEIGYKTGNQHPNWREAMVAYTMNPTASQSSDTTPGNGVSAKFLVNEALRVYPPTKRVYRAWKEDPTSEPIEISADIDACHMRTDIWGANAAQFDPSRWKNLTREQEEAFLPFGSKPFQRPAKPVFGPNIIGILVGTLLDAFYDFWPLDGEEEDEYYWPLALEDGERVEFGEERFDNSRVAYSEFSLFDINLIPCNYLFYSQRSR
jgi:Cytochrome P450